VLVMTATPIPRTLALSLYGDLDLSVLDELPPGRTPIVTRRVSGERSEEVWEFVRKQVALKRQAYIVYPVIEGTMDDQPELDFSHDPEAEIEPPPRGSRSKGQDRGPLSESCPQEANPGAKSGLKSAVEMHEKLRTGTAGRPARRPAPWAPRRRRERNRHAPLSARRNRRAGGHHRH
jgi:ATP-dependent DNA helicase RecG